MQNKYIFYITQNVPQEPMDINVCHPVSPTACDVVNGSCRAGCEEGWTGEKCEIEKTQEQGT